MGQVFLLGGFSIPSSGTFLSLPGRVLKKVPVVGILPGEIMITIIDTPVYFVKAVVI
jgi:hypothetical protein